VLLAAQTLAVAGFIDGNWTQAAPSFGGERRGAPVTAFVRLDSRPIRWRSREMEPYCVLVFDSTLISIVPVLRGVRPGAIVLVNSENPIRVAGCTQDVSIRAVPATRIALEVTGEPRPNAPMLGACAAVTGDVSLNALEQALLRRLPGRSGEAAVDAARAGFQMALSGPQVGEFLDMNGLSDSSALGEQWTTPGLGGPGRPINFAGVVGPKTSLAVRTGDWRSTRPTIDLDRCSGCGICAKYCPDGCLYPAEAGYEVDLAYCKGCGICAHECPRQAITMLEEARL
jgi:pyruvate ferredoxin oxidoreductase gamma subunit